MTKKKSTKRALISSLLILAMCFTMLVGTTFAWFTDEVASGSNRILAGKLDVDLVMDKEANGNYVSIADGQGDIFKEADTANDSTVTLWEPNKTQVVFLGVENKGNLAAKYNIILNVVDGGLIGSLEYAIIDGAKAADLSAAASWEDIVAEAGTNTGVLTAGVVVAAPNGQLFTAPGKTADYFALAVHMKKEAGNEYQEKDVTIDVKVVATQLNYEEDSFGPDYDKDAELPVAIFPVSTAQDLASALHTSEDGAIITLTQDIPEAFALDADADVTLDLGGHNLGYLRVDSGNVTIQNGTISGYNYGVEVYDKDANVVIAKDVTITADYAMILREDGDAQNAQIDMKGTLNGVLWVMGNIKQGNSVINVYGTINNDGTGIALQGAATVNVYEGAKITGETGIEVRAGNLNVYGGEITGTATPNYTVPNGNGTTTTGAGIAVAQHTTKLPINVTIEDGTVKGYVALLEINPQNNSAADLEKINIVVKGGTFEAINGGDPAWKFSIVDQGIVHYTNYTL